MLKENPKYQVPECNPQFPAFLKAKPIWCVSRVGLKMPLTPSTRRNARSNDATTWGTYAEALDAQEVSGDTLNIGYMHDGSFTTIDLDWFKPDETPTDVMINWRHALFQAIISRFPDHYKSVSSSGKGYHIIVDHAVEFNRTHKADGIEIYVETQYMVETFNGEGQLLGDVNGQLDGLWNHLGTLPTNTPDSVADQPVSFTVTEIIERMTSGPNWVASYQQRLWDTGYIRVDESLDDQSLMEHIAFVVRNMDRNHPGCWSIVRAVFEQSALYTEQRVKEKHTTYFDRTAKKAVGYRLTAEADNDRLRDKLATVLGLKQIEPEPTTVALPQPNGVETGIVEPPEDSGMLLALYEHCRTVPYRDFQAGALVSALVHTAALVGYKFTSPTRLGLNLYGFVLAKSGFGKEGITTEARAVLEGAIEKVFRDVRDRSMAQADFHPLDELIAGEFASDSAMRKVFEQSQSVVLWHQEFGKVLKIAARRGGEHKAGVLNLQTRLYTLSGERKNLGKYGAINADSRSDGAARPVFNFIGEGLPDELEGIDPVSFVDGTISRYLMALSKGKKPPRNRIDPTEERIEETIRIVADTIWDLYPQGLDNDLRPFTRLTETQEAYDFRDQKTDEIDERADEIGDSDPVLQASLNRYMEQVIKIGSIVAITRNPSAAQPQVELRDYEWAVRVVESSIAAYKDLIGSGAIGGVDDTARLKRLVEVLRTWKSKDPKVSYRFKDKKLRSYEDRPNFIPRHAISSKIGRKYIKQAVELERLLKEANEQGYIRLAEKDPTKKDDGQIWEILEKIDKD